MKSLANLMLENGVSILIEDQLRFFIVDLLPSKHAEFIKDVEISKRLISEPWQNIMSSAKARRLIERG